MDKLFTLLELQHRAHEARSRDALIHVIVNDTLKIIPYIQAVFFTPDALSIHLERVSGNVVLDPQGLYAADLRKFIKAAVKEESAILSALTPDVHRTHGMVLFFRTGEEGLLGGLWLENDHPYNEAEKRILEELAGIYAQSLALWQLRRAASVFSGLGMQGKWKKYLLVGLAVLAILPVRLSISAPAEIMAKEAEIVTAPFDGLIETIKVKPGDDVKEGDVLAVMENRSLGAQMELAQQEILIAQSALSRMQRESLASPEKKMNLVELQEDIESKKIARDYAQSMKDRSEIRASSDGIAIFSGSHSLKGKPVRTGENIMTIARPENYELLVRIPMESMIEIPEGTNVSFFLNISPLSGHTAKVRSVGYQASADPDGLISYKVIADLPEHRKDMRIGWKGTAHIKGGWTILSYAILRRPIIALRNLIGV